MDKAYIVRYKNRYLGSTYNKSLIDCVKTAKEEIEKSKSSEYPLDLNFLTIEKTVITDVGSLKTAIEVLDENFVSELRLKGGK